MNHQIELLESQLSEMSTRKRFGIYALIIIALIFMSWNLFGETYFHEIQMQEHAVISLEQKLQQRGVSSLKRAIKKSHNERLQLEDDLTNLHFKNQFLRTKLESVGFIMYDQKGAAQILEDILRQSLKHGIAIDVIESTKQERPYVSYIAQKAQIHVTGKGSFLGIVALMQYIDALNVLMRTTDVTIGIDENNATYCDINLSHYGVEL